MRITVKLHIDSEETSRCVGELALSKLPLK